MVGWCLRVICISAGFQAFVSGWRSSRWGRAAVLRPLGTIACCAPGCPGGRVTVIHVLVQPVELGAETVSNGSGCREVINEREGCAEGL